TRDGVEQLADQALEGRRVQGPQVVAQPAPNVAFVAGDPALRPGLRPPRHPGGTGEGERPGRGRPWPPRLARIPFAIVGSTTVDIFLTGLNRIPGAGTDEFTTDAVAFVEDAPAVVIGGNGANTAYVLAGLGEEATLCSVIGDDLLGSIVLDWLRGRAMILDGLVIGRDWATASTVVAMDRRRNRAAFHHPGGTFGFAPDQVMPAVLAGAGVVLLTSYHLLPQFRTPQGRALLATAREGGAVTALDLGPALPPLADLDELGALVPHVTYLLANEHELTSCAGVGDLDTACGRLLDAGASTIVVKRGAAGAAVVGPAGRRDVPGYAVTARTTVGAGDSFNAGFLSAVARGADTVEAARFGNALAALVVGSTDGVLGSPTRAEVLAFMAG
ncbi:MAG TPA: carbohydrate kinase family protein, partial [Candidatus Nanopelagicales bacterium]|nr:carbohydrate kinase family protein [Candidatus Nanopelagicales bacterium]